MAGRRSSHVLDAHRTRGLQHHPPCDLPRGPAAAGRRTTWHLAVRVWRRSSQARASHRKGATPFPRNSDQDTKRSVGADRCCRQEEDRLRAKGEQKIILKSDICQKNKRTGMQSRDGGARHARARGAHLRAAHEGSAFIVGRVGGGSQARVAVGGVWERFRVGQFTAF